MSVETKCVQALFDLLPPDGSMWPKEKRQAWIRTAEELFNLIYELPSDEAAALPSGEGKS